MECRLGSFGCLSRLALGQAIAHAIYLKDVDVVGQAVGESPGYALGAEGFRPFIEGQAARYKRGAALIALRNQFEDQLHFGPRERDDAKFVDNQQFGVGHLFLHSQQAKFVTDLYKFVDQGRGGGEANRRPFQADCEPPAEVEVVFAGAAKAADRISCRPCRRSVDGLRPYRALKHKKRPSDRVLKA